MSSRIQTFSRCWCCSCCCWCCCCSSFSVDRSVQAPDGTSCVEEEDEDVDGLGLVEVGIVVSLVSDEVRFSVDADGRDEVEKNRIRWRRTSDPASSRLNSSRLLLLMVCL